MIKPPGKNKSKEGWRALVEATAQLIPPTAFLARLYQTTYPSEAAKEREEWEGQVSELLNSRFEGRLKAFGRLDFEEQCYSWGRTQNISSAVDCGVGRVVVNLSTPIDEDYIVNVQSDHGDARVTEKSATSFSIQIQNDGKATDSGFVFILNACSN